MTIKSLPFIDQPTPCAGKWALFDSRVRADHLRAKKLCGTCTIVTECAANLVAVAKSPSNLGGSPEGTWAGRLVGHDQEQRLGRCGTDAGYHRHRGYDEDPCKRCLDAHAAQNRRRYEARKEAS